MRNLRDLLCLLGVWCLLLPGSQAAIVPDLYSATVPVSDRSAAELAEAATAALSQVLVKVSGSQGVLQSPEVQGALGSARSRVQTYAFIGQGGQEDSIQVRFEFDPGYVTDLVRRSGAPLWTANRPVVLAWVVIEEQGQRRFMSEDSDAALAAALNAEFSRRGLLLQLPLHDLKDAAALRAADAWGRDSGKLQTASDRYDVDDIAVARVSPDSDDGLAVDWAYFFGDERITAASLKGTPEVVFRQGADLVADAMAARYAVTPSSGEPVAVRMLVSGVFEYSDYAGIARWLRSLEPITYANLERMQGDRLTLVLGTRAAPGSLRSIIELNDRLVPLQATDPFIPLSYRWQK